MQYPIRLMVVLLIISAVQYTACTPSKSESYGKIEPAHVDHLDDDDHTARVTFTEDAMWRTGIELGQVGETRATRSGKTQKFVPYGALIYDPHGDTWVYVSPEPRVFVRKHVTVDYVELSPSPERNWAITSNKTQGKVILKDGPPAGTKVVIVGTAEVYGTEFEVGH